MTLALALTFGLIIGLSLGALGGGGSILTVPALVYAVGESARSATTGSLVIVGVTAGVATLAHARAGRVRWGAGAAFGVAGVAASFAGTALNARVDAKLLLVCFAALMLVAAAAMLAKTSGRTHPGDDGPQGGSPLQRGTQTAAAGDAQSTVTAQLATRTSHAASSSMLLSVALPVLLAGLVVGFLTGFLGVGGGFIIVPALVLTLKYEMPTAVGTSLMIISLNSGVALLARSGHQSFHWAVIVPFTLAAIAGSSVGKRVADRVSGPQLTRAFAVLLLAVAGYVLVQATA